MHSTSHTLQPNMSSSILLGPSTCRGQKPAHISPDITHFPLTSTKQLWFAPIWKPLQRELYFLYYQTHSFSPPKPLTPHSYRPSKIASPAPTPPPQSPPSLHFQTLHRLPTTYSRPADFYAIISPFSTHFTTASSPGKCRSFTYSSLTSSSQLPKPRARCTHAARPTNSFHWLSLSLGSITSNFAVTFAISHTSTSWNHSTKQLRCFICCTVFLTYS